MKKTITLLAAALCVLCTFAFCGAQDITLDELYQANQSAAIAENYDSLLYVSEQYDAAGELVQRVTGNYLYDDEGWRHEETYDYIVSEALSCGLSDNGNAVFYYTYERKDDAKSEITKTAAVLPGAEFKDFVSDYLSMFRGCYEVEIVNVKEEDGALIIECEAYYPGDEEGSKLSPWTIVYTADAKTLALRSVEETQEDGSRLVTTFVYNEPQEFTCKAKQLCESGENGTTELTVTIIEPDREPAVQHYVFGNDTNVYFNSMYGGAFYNDEFGLEPIDTLTLTGEPLEIYALAGVPLG